MSDTSPKSETKTLVSSFRAKVTFMKNWKPASNPSNRDRLELYALHKQAVSGDTPAKDPPPSTLTPAERAKIGAWKTKRGLTQHEAIKAYLKEADRQLTTYGTAPSTSTTPTNTPNDSTNNRRNGAATAAADGEESSGGTLQLTPRGLAAIPLLCAAASETRAAYLIRLRSTPKTDDGWWQRQEPLCGDPGSFCAYPEHIIIYLAGTVEYLSLLLSCNTTISQFLDTFWLRPGIFQSLLWPLHNVLLVVWIMVIFLSSLMGSAIIMTKSILFGSKSTGVTAESIFLNEVIPCKRGASCLCESHQVVSVRLLGLVLYPLGFICEIAQGFVNKMPGTGGTNLFVGGIVYVVSTLFFWWYWLIVLPWIGVSALAFAGSIGWCYSLIELASSL